MDSRITRALGLWRTRRESGTTRRHSTDRHARWESARLAARIEPLELRLLLDSAGPQIRAALPDGLVLYADHLDVTFNEAIDAATLTADDVRVIPSVPSALGGYYTDGYAEEVVVIGSLAYLADGENGGLRIFDVSDPAAPALLGQYDTPGQAWDVAVSGGYAYVADEWEGLAVIDVSDPYSPALVGNYPSPNAWSIVVEGSVAYLGDGNGLYVLDVSDPSSPALMGHTTGAGWCAGLAVSGTTAYAVGYGGMKIVDVSDPYAPTRVGSWASSDVSWDVAVEGGLAYVADGLEGLAIIDVSNPAAPALAGSIATDGEAVDVEISNSLAFVADEEEGLLVIDVSDPAAPVTVSHLSDGEPEGVFVAGSTAYLADGDDGLTILQVLADVSGVSFAGGTSYELSFATPLGDAAYSVRVGPDIEDLSGNPMDQDGDGTGGETPDDAYEFTFTVDATAPPPPRDLGFDDDTGSEDHVTADTLLTFSWSPPDDLSPVSTYEYRWDGGTWTTHASTNSPDLAAGAGTHTFEVRAIDTFARTGEPASITVIVDASAPAAPTNLRMEGATVLWDAASDNVGVWKYQYRTDGGAWADVFYERGPTSLTDASSGLCEVRAIDKAGNVGPTASATLTADYGPRVTGHTAAVDAFGEYSLTLTFDQAVDGATFTADDVGVLLPGPQPQTTAYTPAGWADGVLGSGDRAYVIVEGHLDILDASDPCAPVLLGSAPLAPDIKDGDVEGDYAYLAVGDDGLVVLDMTNPASPQYLPAVDLGGWAYDIDVIAARAYIMVQHVGLVILDVSDPATPAVLGVAPFDGEAEVMAVSETLICLCVEDDAIYTIDASNPAVPTLLSEYALETEDLATAAASRVYATDDYLWIMDFSNPLAPALLGSYDPGGWIEDVEVFGPVALVILEDGGLHVVKVQDPASPELMYEYVIDEPTGIEVFGNVAYVAAGADGLLVLEILHDDITVTALSSTSYRVDFGVLADGFHGVAVGADLADPAGNPMDQDGDGNGGQEPADAYLAGFLAGPEIVVSLTGSPGDATAHDFGNVAAGDSEPADFTVRNDGLADLVVSLASGLSGAFSILPVNGAGSGDDWTIPAGQTAAFTVTFAPTALGQYSQTLTLTSNDADEGDYEIDLTGRGMPTVSISDTSVVEGDTGEYPVATFAVTLSQAAPWDVTVYYATQDGTAVGGADYDDDDDWLTIPAGHTSGAIEVTVRGDNSIELDETFTVSLSQPDGALIVDDEATCTILDDGDTWIEVTSLADVVAVDGVVTLREAIQAANTNSAVNEAPAGSSVETDVITFAPGLSGGVITLGGTELRVTDELIIHGPGSGDMGIYGNFTSRVFYCEATELTLTGLTIAYGLADRGGGIYNDYGTVTLIGSTVSNNTASYYWGGQGGGIWSFGGTVTVIDSEITLNRLRTGDSGTSGYAYGGGLWANSSNLTLTNTVVSDNLAEWDSADKLGDGGGMYVLGGSLTITGGSVSENLAAGNGAGIHMVSVSAELTNVTISENLSSGEGDGGGIFTDDTVSLTLTEVTLTDNHAGDNGGGMFCGGGIASGPVALIDSTVSDNYAQGGMFTDGGGGIWNSGPAMTIENCTINRNFAQYTSGGGFCNLGTIAVVNSEIVGNGISGFYVEDGGGGLYNSGTLTLTNCTVAGNFVRLVGPATGGGGGIFNDGGSVTLNNTIVALNDAPSSADIHGGFTSNSSLTGGDPGFVRNPSAGPDATWYTSDDDYGDIHLLSSSPCVNAGDPSGDYTGQHDIDGQPRVMYGRVDIGADEYLLAGDATMDGAVNAGDYMALKTGLGSGGSAAQGDFNADGQVNCTDLALLQANMGTTYTPAGGAAQEVATAALADTAVDPAEDVLAMSAAFDPAQEDSGDTTDAPAPDGGPTALPISAARKARTVRRASRPPARPARLRFSCDSLAAAARPAWNPSASLAESAALDLLALRPLELDTIASPLPA